MTTEPQMTFIDNPHAPEVFSTWASGFLVANGCVHITFEAVRSDYSNEGTKNNRVVIARVVMPLGGAQGLADGLSNYLKQQQAPGSPPLANPVVH